MNDKVKRFAVGALTLATLISPVSMARSSAAEPVKVVNIHAESVKLTANAVNDYLYNNVDNLYILSADDYVDSLTGGVIIGEHAGQILYMGKDGLDEAGKERLKKAKNVYVIGGESSVGTEVEKSPQYRGRIAGKNRYETAVDIAKTLKDRKGIIVANGENFPDALSATALAIHMDYAIILVQENTVPDSVKQYLTQCHGDVLFVGGEQSLSPAVKESVLQYMGKPVDNVDALTVKGDNRYTTSLEVAKKFTGAKSVILVNGQNPQDALLGASLAADKKAPVVLTDNENDKQLVDYLKSVNEQIYAISTQDNISTDHIKDIVAQAKGIKESDVIVVDQKGQEIVKTQSQQVQTEKVSLWVKEALNVRDQAGMQSNVLGVLAQGDKVTGEVVDGWLKFMYNGKTAYCSMNYLSSQEIKKAAPQAQTVAKEESQNKSDKNFSYSRVITMTATAYTPDPRENGGSTLTALGTKVRPGAVAVDPRVIKLGTRLYVEGYGFCTAEDTGGAIKGNKIDLCFATSAQANQFGRRSVKVYILN